MTNLNAAASLLGRTLNNKWEVIREVPKGNGTGGHFSYGYIVRSRAGEEAFLKAMDVSSALQHPNWLEKLKELTEAYLYERNVLFMCRDRRLSRVVKAIDEGTELVQGAIPPQVQYLVFEKADGDIRQQMSLRKAGDAGPVLRTLHHIAVGLDQLHRSGIAHQDMKPSNVLVFDQGNSSKIGDLGRASSRGQSALHDHFPVAGDRGYAPPELLYSQVSMEWAERRFACDAYQLGSLTMFLFSQVSATPSILGRLDPLEHPKNWQGTYSQVLPRVQAAFEDALSEFGMVVPVECRREVVEIVRQLCDPDPAMRGHPLNKFLRGNPYSLERYVSIFNRLARRAEYGLIGPVRS